VAGLEVLIDGAQGILGPASGTKAVADVQKFPLEDRFQYPFDGPLDDAVLDRGDAQRSLTAPGLGMYVRRTSFGW